MNDIQCLTCKWLNALTGGCKAFPNDIPFEITNGEELHNEVRKDQEGEYIYEEGESEELKNILEKEK